MHHAPQLRWLWGPAVGTGLREDHQLNITSNQYVVEWGIYMLHIYIYLYIMCIAVVDRGTDASVGKALHDWQ